MLMDQLTQPPPSKTHLYLESRAWVAHLQDNQKTRDFNRSQTSASRWTFPTVGYFGESLPTPSLLGAGRGAAVRRVKKAHNLKSAVRAELAGSEHWELTQIPVQVH